MCNWGHSEDRLLVVVRNISKIQNTMRQFNQTNKRKMQYSFLVCEPIPKASFQFQVCGYSNIPGVCETVMAPEAKLTKAKILSKEPYPNSYSDSDLSDDDEMGSSDFQIDMDFGLRERSMTAARLEKLECRSKKTSKMKHIKWETNKKSGSESSLNLNDENEELFIKKEVPKQKEPTQSGLTRLMTKFTNLPLNPFMEYARYDGTGQINIPIRKYRIFLTMLPEDQRNYPIEVCCVATAKIQHLIGLILLQFSMTHADFPFRPITHYGLYITEDDGEVDSDFPALDRKECVAKFGFTCLGLVEHTGLPRNVSFEDTETVSSYDNGRKRPPSTSKADENKQTNKDNLIMEKHHKEVEAPLYKSYRVHVIHKVRQKTEVHLGISGEKFEIDPITQKNSKFTLVRQKPVSHHMDSIAWCEVGDVKGPKMTFRVTYLNNFGEHSGESRHSFPLNSSFPPGLHSSPSFKNYEFESDFRTASEIVEKIKLILDLRSSQVKRDYLESKEKKHVARRKTFNLK